jgi:hypothetical protein
MFARYQTEYGQERKTMESILTLAHQVLTITPARWLELTRTLSPELLSLPPAPKEWSALECLQHLIDTERDVFPVRVRAYLAGQDFPAFDPDSQGSRSTVHRSPIALAEEFDQLRQASLAQLAPLTEADLGRQARHAALGMVTLSETMNTWAAHDLNHTVQAERALMQPFIRGCGPFQFRFADHVAKERNV